MLEEAIEYLNIGSAGTIVDATLNGGGHTFEILERYPDVKILGIEWDPDIFQEFKKKIENFKKFDSIIPVNDSYVNLKSIVRKQGLEPGGILFDLGVSSFHYEKGGRGFSFQKNEFLDMRFNPESTSITASDIINKESKEEIQRILHSYGEEVFAEAISEKIVKSRASKPIVNSLDLVKIIEEAVPSWYRKGKINPATKTFQALRIAVNNELDNVEKGVLSAIEILKPGGRLVVISFQGLEDKIVRETFKNKAKQKIINWVIKGTIRPKWAEVEKNPRARSAKMKVVEKI